MRLKIVSGIPNFSRCVCARQRCVWKCSAHDSSTHIRRRHKYRIKLVRKWWSAAARSRRSARSSTWIDVAIFHLSDGPMDRRTGGNRIRLHASAFCSHVSRFYFANLLSANDVNERTGERPEISIFPFRRAFNLYSSVIGCHDHRHHHHHHHWTRSTCIEPVQYFLSFRKFVRARTKNGMKNFYEDNFHVTY